MTGRTVTFNHPFTLPGMDRAHAAGTFAVTTERETLDVVWPAYHVTTALMIPTPGGYESWPVSGADLDRLLADDNVGTRP